MFFHEILQLNKFGMWILNMSILFSNSSPKYLNKAFLVKFRHFRFFFHEIVFHHFSFCTNKTNSRMQISNMTIVFSNSTPEIRKPSLFSPKFKHFYFAPNVAIRQIRGCWFEIWHGYFEFMSENTQIKQFLS